MTIRVEIVVILIIDHRIVHGSHGALVHKLRNHVEVIAVKLC